MGLLTSIEAVRDGKLIEVISTNHADNFSVYGVEKMHATLRWAEATM